MGRGGVGRRRRLCEKLFRNDDLKCVKGLLRGGVLECDDDGFLALFGGAWLLALMLIS